MTVNKADSIAQASRHLEDHQLKNFDQEYVTPPMWAQLTDCIARAFPGGEFTFLDVGGGNGKFTDSLLNQYPNSRAVLLDNAEVLLQLNKPHPRKSIIKDSVESFLKSSASQTFDLIHLNWLLHHLILESYSRTRDLQRVVLASIPRLLSKGGRLSVFENMYNGRHFHQLPSWLIYQLTASRVLAPLIRRLGANTAGCGVCFLGELEWRKVFGQARLEIESSTLFEDWEVSRFRRLFLHVGSVRVGHFWMSPQDADSTGPANPRAGS